MRFDARRRGLGRRGSSERPASTSIGVLSDRLVMITTLFSFEDSEGAKLFVRVLARAGEELALLRDIANVWLINPNEDPYLQVHIETIAAECGGSVLLIV